MYQELWSLQLSEVGSFIILFLQMKKLRLREVTDLPAIMELESEPRHLSLDSRS